MVAPLTGDTTVRVELPVRVGVAVGVGAIVRVGVGMGVMTGVDVGMGVGLSTGVGVADEVAVGEGVTEPLGVGVGAPEINWLSTFTVICSAAGFTRDGDGLLGLMSERPYVQSMLPIENTQAPLL